MDVQEPVFFSDAELDWICDDNMILLSRELREILTSQSFKKVFRKLVSLSRVTGDMAGVIHFTPHELSILLLLLRACPQ
jgi:hypothetical protein